MDNILKAFDSQLLSYLISHTKEIHEFSTDYDYQKLTHYYFLLDDDSVIFASSYDFQDFTILTYYPHNNLFIRELDCRFPFDFHLDFAPVIDHGLVKSNTSILTTDMWNLISFDLKDF